MDSKKLLDEVCQLALEAGRLFFNKGELQISEKNARDYVTQVDLSVNDYLIARLPKLLQGSRIISEETSPSHPIDDGYNWVIDPVDGTTNLIYSLPLYAISIGLLHNLEPVLGVVFNPASGEMFSGVKGGGAYLNGEPIQVCGDETLESTLVLTETNPYADRTKTRSLEVIGRIFLDCIDLRVTGSAALDIVYIACGRGGVLVAESLSTWDCAAGCAILAEAGGCYTNWQGKPFSFAVRGGQSIIASNRKLHDIALGYTKIG